MPETFSTSAHKLNGACFFRWGTPAQHLTLCGVCVCVCGVWCPLDGCDAPSGHRGKTTVRSQSVCKVHVYTQLWVQNRRE